jgi:hypothetical protein
MKKILFCVVISISNAFLPVFETVQATETEAEYRMRSANRDISNMVRTLSETYSNVNSRKGLFEWVGDNFRNLFVSREEMSPDRRLKNEVISVLSRIDNITLDNLQEKKDTITEVKNAMEDIFQKLPMTQTEANWFHSEICGLRYILMRLPYDRYDTFEFVGINLDDFELEGAE